MFRKFVLAGVFLTAGLAGTAASAAVVVAPPPGTPLITGSSWLCIGADCVFDQQNERLVGGTAQQFDIGIDPQTGDILAGGGSIFDAEGTLILDPGGNIDPIFNAGVSATDFGAPSSFAVLVSAPLLPTFPAGTLLNSVAHLVGTLSDPTGGTISVSPFLSSGLLDTLVNGAPITTAGPGYSTIATGPYGPYTNSSNLLCPPGGCNTFGLLLSFTGSGNGDQYNFSATHTLQPAQVPIPATLMLISLGLVSFGFARKKKHF